MNAGGRPDRDAMRAELLERAMVRAFAEQVEVEIGEDAAVAVRIVELDQVPAVEDEAETVVELLRARGRMIGQGKLVDARPAREASSARRSPVDRSTSSADAAAGWKTRTTVPVPASSGSGPSTANGSRFCPAASAASAISSAVGFKTVMPLCLYPVTPLPRYPFTPLPLYPFPTSLLDRSLLDVVQLREVLVQIRVPLGLDLRLHRLLRRTAR